MYVGVSASLCPERRGAGDARAIESTFSRLRSNFQRASDRARGSRDVTRAFLTFLQIWHSGSQAA